jgi:hypothetical protein
MSLKCGARASGKPRALSRDMYDVDAIEAINFEQLVTVTDRLLLRQGRGSKRRLSTNRIGPPLIVEAAHERTEIIQRPLQRAAVDATVVLSSAILTILLFIAILA